MARSKSIKGIDKNIWLEFKNLAAGNNDKTGKIFEIMVQEYKNRSAASWHNILNSGKILSDEEARDIDRFVRELRREQP